MSINLDCCRLALLLVFSLVAAWAVEPPTAASDEQPLLTSLGLADGTIAAPSSSEVVITRHDDQPGKPLDLAVTPKADAYPGVILRPASGTWDFSHRGRVEVQVTNPWVKEITVNLRVDNGEDGAPGNPWNGEMTRIEPGGSGVISVRFGYSYGKKGYALDPAKIARIVVSLGKPLGPMQWRIDSLMAAGLPGEIPPDKRKLRLRDGVILGSGCSIDATRQATGIAGGAVTMTASSIDFVTSTADGGVRVTPAKGRWDLGDHLQVAVQARNAGTTPLKLRARLESAEGHTPWITGATLAVGVSGEVVVPFPNAELWNGEPTSGTQFASDVTTGLTVQVVGEGQRHLVIERIIAGLPPRPTPPEWLGQRPPMHGNWTQTMNDNFDGTTVDPTHWSVKGENYNDPVSHFSAHNVIVADGVARLRFEKKRGHINDDPTRPETDYTTGFLTGFGLWTQRYGYFESRMKLPTAPGLWPAFWMMPDRGPIPGMSNGKRGSTSNGGMEYDIFEYLTRYGANRYNLAMHWDDYGKNHKSAGNGRIYVQPDADGFITAGMLWEPGKLAFYGNGVLVAAWENPRVGNLPSHFIYTYTCGGWGGNDLDDSGLPDDFVIDWVRAWQRDDLAALPPTVIPPLAPATK